MPLYLAQKDFISEYNKSVENQKPTDLLISMFQKIATNLYTSALFNCSNKDKNECINFAIGEAWKKWDKFDKNRTDNIFSFFTTMIANDIRLHYRQLNKGKNINISIDAVFSNENKK